MHIKESFLGDRMKHTYEVEILGQKFNIKSTQPKPYVDKIVNYVTSKMKELHKNSKALTAHHVAILTLLNITDELFQSENEVQAYKEKVIHRAKNILQMIDVQPST